MLAAKSADGQTPKRTSLPSRAPSGPLAALTSAHVDDGDDEAPERRHEAEDRPALATVADEQPVGARQREGDDEQQEDLEEVGQGGGVLERVGGVGVEVAAAVGAELLDGLLRGDEAALDDLRAAGGRRDRRGLREVLDDAAERAAATAATTAIGSSTRTTARTRSTQKLPMVAPDERARPRTSAMATARPTAGETKFWTVSPTVCTRGDTPDSPAYDCQLVLVTKETAVLRAVSTSIAAPRGEGERALERR